MKGNPSHKSSRTPGGFANAEIPSGFENPRSRLPDAPLSRRGRFLYYGALAIVVIAGIAVIVVSAAQ